MWMIGDFADEIQFASTWGPMAWTVASEIYPGRYRSQAIALCSGSNWLFNFLLAFFTPFISKDINFAYGYVFAGCNLFAVFFVFFFLPETAERSLEGGSERAMGRGVSRESYVR
jgi:SP family sugar:H+ symporter-like MFS transporter